MYFIIKDINIDLDMSKFDNIGITQSKMSQLTGMHRASFSKFITSNGISPIDDGSKKTLHYSIENTRVILSSLVKGGLPKIDKKIQCFYNFKGGVGKTSLTYQVSSILSILGYNVLVIDSDPQAHLSTSLSLLDNSNLTLYDVIVKGVSVSDAIVKIFPGLDCIPSNISLTRIEVPLNQMPKREEQIGLMLEPIKHKYDFIIFDTNPTISYLNRNILSTSSRINIVSETQPYSVNGMKHLFEDLINFFDRMRLEMPDISIIPNKYEGKMATSQEAMGLLNKYYGDYLIKDFAIRKSEDMNISAREGLPIPFFCKTNSNAFSDLIELIWEIVNTSSENYYSEISRIAG